MTPPSSPASDSVFPFDFTSPFATIPLTLQPPFSLKYPVFSTESPHLGWPSLEAAKPSTKTSRFTWSEMDYSNSESSFKNLSADHPVSTQLTHSKSCSECHFCSMVPYGALCTNCNRIQKSKAIALATPPAAAWPLAHTLGDREGTKAPEEALLKTLDAELFEQINVPHELDEWGRRVYNDCGHRILYYQDADGNTVVGYEGSYYSSSVISDYDDDDDDDDEPNHHWRAGNSEVRDQTVRTDFPQQPGHDDVRTHPTPADPDDDDEQKSVISGYEAWSPASTTTISFDMMTDANNPELKQRRFAEFIAEMDARKRATSEDRGERIAGWIDGVGDG